MNNLQTSKVSVKICEWCGIKGQALKPYLKTKHVVCFACAVSGRPSVYNKCRDKTNDSEVYGVTRN